MKLEDPMDEKEEHGGLAEEGVESVNFIGRVYVPWKELGPKHTRWINGAQSAKVDMLVHGHWFAGIEDWEPPRGHCGGVLLRGTKPIIRRSG